MAGTVIYQIYWNDNQLPNLFEFAKPYKNETLTPFFENSVIREIIPRETSDKIGVASWALRQKIGGGVPMRQPFTEEVINWEYDVLSLGRNQVIRTMLFRMNEWHKGTWGILNRIFEKLGRPHPEEPEHPIYQNHFMAKRQIYQDYVGELLIPVMDLMKNDEEISQLVNVDSGYFKLKMPNTEFALRCEQAFGKKDYCPLHAFLCERLFSIFIHGKVNVKYL